MPSPIPSKLQELPPKWAHFWLGIEKFMRDDLRVDLAGKSILVAFSGGADSTALLLFARIFCERHGGRLVAAHVDHGLRSESAADAAHCSAVCESLGIEFRTKSFDIGSFAKESGLGLEDAGRKARYDYFAELLESESLDYLFAGHHLGDLCEDIIMRMIRGTGWPALAGMDGFEQRRNLVRPFLLSKKSELVAMLTDIEVDWLEDLSNDDPAMTRNRVRHAIYPLLLEENPKYPEAMARLWKMARIDDEYWADAAISDTPPDFLPKELLQTAHPALRLRLYKAYLDRLGPGQVLAETLFRLEDSWVERRTGATFQFPGHKYAKIRSNGIVFGLQH